MGRIAKNYIYNLIYQSFSMFVPLITAPYLARTLGPNGTGIYGYVNSMTTLICTFVLLGISILRKDPLVKEILFKVLKKV